MKTAAIVYRSRTGTTGRLAEEIGAYLRTRDIESTVTSVGECDPSSVADVDYLLLRFIACSSVVASVPTHRSVTGLEPCAGPWCHSPRYP